MKHVFLLTVLTASLIAAPNTLNYQGKLIDVNGVGVTGPMDFRFTFHTNASTADTNAVWTEVLTDVYVNKGYYSVQLGAVTPITVNFADTSYYLGIKVTNSTNNVFTWQNNTELTPRVQLTPVPYAMTAYDSIPVPVGTVLPFFGNIDDIGWMYNNARFLACDGRTISRTNNATLIGEQFQMLFMLLYKTANNCTTNAAYTAWTNGGVATLPDLRGMFMRGVDNMNTSAGQANADPGWSARTNKAGTVVGNRVGSLQDDAFQGHKHGLYDPTHNHAMTQSIPSTGGNYSGIGTSAAPIFPDNAAVNHRATGVLVENPINGTNGIIKNADETRPKNVYVNYIIKY